MPTFIKQPENKTICYGTAQLSVVISPAAVYQWYEGNNSTPVLASNGTISTYTATPATYTVTASVGACSVTSNEAVVSTMTATAGTAPGSTVTFAAFNPCADAAVGTVWYLTDNRSTGGNNQTYKVKMMPDGHVWMVQNMKFGACSTTGTWRNDNSADSVITTPTVASGYVGHCRSNHNGASDNGFLYNWAAAINNSDAYYSSTITVGCSGTGAAANACRGICPENWHIPTSGSKGELNVLFSFLVNAGLCVGSSCWYAASSPWENKFPGLCNSNGSTVTERTDLWSSTYFDLNTAYAMIVIVDNANTLMTYSKNQGRTVRCVRNY
jgi:uncharacterized protein (TIGR02145 family)